MDTVHFLNAHEVAERLDLTVHQVYRRLHRGDIPSVMGGRHGQQYLVDPVVLQEYIDAGQPLSLPRRDHTRIGIPEAARLLGFTPDTVRNMCYRGTFSYVRGAGKNGHLRLNRDEVENYLASRKTA